MEAPEQAMTRLLGALEVLLDQEAIHVSHEDHVGLLSVQARITPLIKGLEALCSKFSNAVIRAKIALLFQKRRATEDGMAARIERIREDLDRTRGAQRRLAKVAPAYLPGAIAHGPSRLRAVS